MKEARERTVVFRVSHTDYRRIQQRAAAQSMGVSEYLRILACEECCPLADLKKRVEELERWLPAKPLQQLADAVDRRENA